MEDADVYLEVRCMPETNITTQAVGRQMWSVFGAGGKLRNLAIEVSLGALLAIFMPHLTAGTISFDTLTDGDAITTQYPGITFSNAIVLNAGSSLNEFELPPHSGSNVASDFGGPITIDFAAPVADFSAYFTYLVPLTATAFDGTGNPITSTFSLFASNLALSGDPGSGPNELITLAVSTGISRVSIQGDPGGGSFVLDDLSFDPVSNSAVPEPSSGLLIACGLLLAAAVRSALTPRGAVAGRQSAGGASAVLASRSPRRSFSR